MERVHRLNISELHKFYEEDKQLLIYYQKKYGDLKRRLERERVLEGLQLINCRARLEEELEETKATIALLNERKVQYEQIFEI